MFPAACGELVVLALACGALFRPDAAPRGQDGVNPSLRAAVERFYAVQESENIPDYLALWAAGAQRPHPAQLKYVFDTGDDTFSELEIKRVTSDGERATVRVSVVRDRTMTLMRRPDGSSPSMHSVVQANLTYVSENGEWKLVREAPAGEALADALVAAGSAADREALLAAEPDLVNSALITSVARRADGYAIASQYAAAQRIYELIIELAGRIGDRRGEGEAWQNLANALYFQRKMPEALAAYERRLAIERDRNDEAGIAAATLGIATVLYSRFEYADALVRYREALDIQERLRDVSGTATTLISVGNVQYLQGDHAGALADYRRSRDLYRQVGDTRGEAGANDGLGRTLAAQGDLAGALNAYGLVLGEGQARNDRGLQANASKSIGEIHFRLGNLEIARARFDESRSHFEALRDNANVGRVWHATGLTDLVANRFAPAEQDYTNSIAACSTGPKPLQDLDCAARGIVGLAFAQAAQQHYAAAIASYRRGITVFVGLERAEDAARAEVGLSQALYGSQDYAAALAAATHARDQAIALKKDDVLWRALAAEARANRRLAASGPEHLRRERSDAAMQAANQAVAAVDRLARGFEDLPVEPIAADTAGAYSLLAILQAENGDAPAALRTIALRRAHALRIALAANERDIHRGMTGAERDEERRLTVDVTSIAAQIRSETQLPRPDAARIARLGEQLASAKAKRMAARQQLFERIPELKVWRGLGGAADAAEALVPLAGMPVLAQFIVGEDDLLVTITRERDGVLEQRAYVANVDSRTVTERITQALDPAAIRSTGRWREAAAALVSLFPAAAWNSIAAAPQVLIAPDDVLWHLPFEALPVEGGVLGDRTAVRYLGSATSLLPTADETPRPWAPLAIAAPELTSAARERMSATAPDWNVRADATPDAEARAAAASLLGSTVATVLAGAAATEAAFRERAPAASVIHVAAPFRVNSASPLFSPVLLAGEASTPAAERDGLLEAREIFDLDLPARTAVFTDGAALSMRASASALDVVRWAWRAAGVPTIVVPRWAADRAATTALLEEFYRQMKEGRPADAALRRAQAAVRAREETSAPVCWAGWMVVGR